MFEVSEELVDFVSILNSDVWSVGIDLKSLVQEWSNSPGVEGVHRGKI